VLEGRQCSPAVHDRYSDILAEYRPYIVTTPKLRDRMNLEPLGHRLNVEHVYSSIHMSSGPFLDLIQHLDSRCYTVLQMRMPRWAFYDCGELPGAIVGLGRRAADLAPEVLRALEVPEGYTGLVPLTMFVAIPMLDRGHWLGHTINSIREVMDAGPTVGARRLTVAIALSALRAKRFTATTQWASDQLDVHAHFGPLELLAAWVPQHDKPATCVVRAAIDEDKLERALSTDPPSPRYSRIVDPTDDTSLIGLHRDIEAGSRVFISGTTFERGGARRVPLLYQEVQA
jgi:hypothetical protein